MTLHVNSQPPQVEKLFLNRLGVDPDYYVVCFFMPVISSSVNAVHYNDTKKMVININGTDHVYYFNYGSSGYSFYDLPEGNSERTKITDNFLTSMTTEGLNSSQAVFSSYAVPSNYVRCYYKTTVPVSDSESKFSVKLIDDAGLYSEAKISNKGQKLTAPSISDSNGTGINSGVYAADEDSNALAVYFDHDLKTTESESCDNVIIDYKVYEWNSNAYSLIKSGSLAKTSGNRPSITIAPGTYKIEAVARKDYFVKSEESSVSGIKVSRPSVYYISQNGADDEDHDGTKVYPYKSINKCVEEMCKQIVDFGLNTDGYTINLLTDLVADERDDINGGFQRILISNETYKNKISNECSSNDLRFKITIKGYNGNKKIDANRQVDSIGSINKPGRCLSLNAYNYCSYVLQDLTITGGYAQSSGAGVWFGNSDQDYCELELVNVNVEGNKMSPRPVGGTNAGAGLYYAGNGKLKLRGTVNIRNNFYISGDTKENNNLFLDENSSGTQSKITVTGSLAGSTIGISTETSPEPGANVIFTENFGAKNIGKEPGVFFRGDKYGVTESGSGSLKEGSLTKGGGEISLDKFNKQLEIVPSLTVIDKNVFEGRSTVNLSFKLLCDGVEVNPSDISIKLYMGSVLMTSDNKALITFNLNWPSTNYYVKVFAKYDGKEYDNTFTLPVVEKDDLTDWDEDSNGPDSGTYYISTTEALEKIRKWIQVKNNTFEDVTFVMTNDIQLPEDFSGFGICKGSATSEKVFMGTFDGGGHSLIIKSLSSGCYSIFGDVNGTGSKKAVLKNITLEGNVVKAERFSGLASFVVSTEIKNCINKCNIKVTGNNINASGLCSTVATNSLVENCINYGKIESTLGAAAGISLYINEGVINNCLNKGDVIGGGKSSTTLNISAGGICVRNSSSILNCGNEGSVSGTGTVGGIAARSYGAQSIIGIVNCYNTGKVKSVGDVAAGIAGETYSSNQYVTNISNCCNTGEITSSNSSGILGRKNADNIIVQYTSNYYLSNASTYGCGSEEENDPDGVYSYTKTQSNSKLTELNEYLNYHVSFSVNGKSYSSKPWILNADGNPVLKID